MATKLTFDNTGSSESLLSSHNIIEGYFIQRPTHVEINVKSPYLAKLMENKSPIDLIYSDFGMVYDVDFLEDNLLYQTMSKNNNVFLTSAHNANISYLRSPRLADGFKTKIRGIVFPEDLVTYEHKFNSLIPHLVKYLTKPKPKPIKSPYTKLTTINRIREGKIYDGYGWVHADNCECMFNSSYQPISLCDKCDSFSVRLQANTNNNIKRLGVCN